MKALMPAQAGAPADIGLPGQPARATPFGVSRENARTIQGFLQAALGVHLFAQEQAEGHDDLSIAPLQPIELLALRQRGKRCAQVGHRIAVEGAFARKARPLAKYRQRHHLATRQRGGWSGAVLLRKACRLAKLIAHEGNTQPVEEVPAGEAPPASLPPVEEVPSEETSAVEETSVEEMPAVEVPPSVETPVEGAPASLETPMEKVPLVETSAGEALPQSETSVEEISAVEMPAVEAPPAVETPGVEVPPPVEPPPAETPPPMATPGTFGGA